MNKIEINREINHSIGGGYCLDVVAFYTGKEFLDHIYVIYLFIWPTSERENTENGIF